MQRREDMPYRLSVRPRRQNVFSDNTHAKEGAVHVPYYRSNLIVLWITTFLAAASWTQVVPFLPLYLEELGVKENLSQWSGMVFSLQFVAGIIMAPIWGRLADQRGRKLLTIRAGLCLSAIYLLTGLATQAWHVAVLRFLNGALTGFIPSSMSLVATNTPKHLAARYVAMLQTGQASGSVVGPVFGGVLAGLFGIRGALFTSGCVVLAATLAVIFVVQERNKVVPAQARTIIEDFRAGVQMPALLRVMAITFLAMLASISVQPILVIYMNELAGSPNTALSGLAFSLPGLAFVVSAGTWVRHGEKRGFNTVVRWALLGTALFGFALWAVNSVVVFMLLFFAQGIFLAGLRPAASAIISNEIDQEFHGRAFGMQSSATTLGGMVGPLIAGAVSSYFGNASVFWSTSLILLLGATLLHIFDRRERARGPTPPDRSVGGSQMV